MAFCTVITCMDGRVQRPMLEFVAEKYGYDLPDTITDPGPVKGLADTQDAAYFDHICERVDISVYKHGSSHIFVTGHHDCAGNPVSREKQEEQLVIAVQRFREKYPECTVDKVYINERWECELV